MRSCTMIQVLDLVLNRFWSERCLGVDLGRH